MDIRRVILGAALAMLGYALWNAWKVDYPTANSANAPITPVQRADTEALYPKHIGPDTSPHKPNTAEILEENGSHESNTVSIKTDVLDLTVDLAQGDIISADLLAYPESIDKPEKPFVLLNNQAGQRYTANSNLLTSSGTRPVEALKTSFKTAAESYQLQPNEEQLKVVLTSIDAGGLGIKKTYTFTRGSYLIDVRYDLINRSSAAWSGYVNTQIVRSLPKEDKSTPFHIGSYTGASYSNPGHHRYQKLSFKDMSKTPLDVTVDGGWLAMQQHYFLTAWIPPSNATSRLYSRTFNGTYAIGAVSEAIKLKPGESESVSSQLYVGPEVQDTLKAIAPGLDLTIDYGWLWFISSLLFSVMKLIFSAVGNWGWSIVLVTVLIKLAFYRLSATSYRSMANMRKLQPKLQSLRERYGDDKAKMSQATMALYREEKVNPLSGCLPLLIQIPVFIALYWVLVESIELRQAPFIFWIKDLAQPDPFHVLPLIMGATMLIQQKLNPTPPDPMQAKMMMFLPVLFTALFWNFPAGLVLYWTVNNTLTILQQWYITNKIEKAS